LFSGKFAGAGEEPAAEFASTSCHFGIPPFWRFCAARLVFVQDRVLVQSPFIRIGGRGTGPAAFGLRENRAAFAERLVTSNMPLSYYVEDKMRLSKDKTAVTVNSSLALSSIPPQTFAYRLGNRSALEWVIDQYQLSEDKRSGIRSDPNRPNDPEYIVRLVGQVVRVSVETVRLVAGLPERYAD
jgi:type ISP restriction-modification system protein